MEENNGWDPFESQEKAENEEVPAPVPEDINIEPAYGLEAIHDEQESTEEAVFEAEHAAKKPTDVWEPAAEEPAGAWEAAAEAPDPEPEPVPDKTPDAPQETPRVDFYADGTPVIDHGARTGRSAGEPEKADGRPYRQYQFGNDWRERQVAPSPMGGRDPKKKSKNGLIAAIAIVAVVGILVGALVAGLRATYGLVDSGTQFAEPDTAMNTAEAETKEAESPSPKEAAPTLIPAAPTQSADTSSGDVVVTVDEAGDMSVADVAEMSMPAMVSITTMTVQQVYSFYGGVENRQAEGAGSGIIVGQTDSEILIATNDHVISGAKELSVCFVDEEVVEASVKGTDTQNDLAIVSVLLDDVPAETMEKIRVISIGDSDEIRIGEQVVAIGNALGFGQSVSAGVVSAKNRTVKLEDGEHVLMQTDAAINPGNSGGALLNMKGELIGINEVKYVAEDTEGIGYAIPITFAQPILNELMERETRAKVAKDKRGYLGITCITVQTQYSDMYRIPSGIYVDQVAQGSGAEAAGIQPRDIIVKINDLEVATQEELLDEMDYFAVGDTVKITVSRLAQNNEYHEIEFDVTLTVKPVGLDDEQDEPEEEPQQGREGSSGLPEGFDGFFQIPGR